MKTPLHIPTVFLLCNDLIKIDFFKSHFKDIYYVTIINDCASTLDWVKTLPPEIIFIDFQSIDEPLINFCQHLHRILEKNPIPVFLISKIIKQDLLSDILKAGVTDFIHEPLEANEIFEQIASHFNPNTLNKKIKSITKKIRDPHLVPKNTQILLEKTLVRAQSLRKIIETKKLAMPLCIFMIKLDSLSSLLKTFKEKGITEIIEQVGVILKYRLRTHDILITEGPGHYIVLLPKTSSNAAKIIAEDIQKEISSTTLKIAQVELLVTVSIGVTCFEKEPSLSAKAFEQFEFCLEKIQTSLEKSKKKGNIVISS